VCVRLSTVQTSEDGDGSAKLDNGQITTGVIAVSKVQSMLGRKLWGGGRNCCRDKQAVSLEAKVG